MITKHFIKGQIKPWADFRTVDSPKKQTNKFVFLLWRVKKQKKKSLVHFLGRIYGAPICLQFYLTFKEPGGQKYKKNHLFLVQMKALEFASEIYWL